MSMRLGRVVKLAAIAVSALTVLATAVFGVPDLSSIAGTEVFVVMGLGAMVWTVVRFGREDGFLRNGLLADVAAADRRLVKNARRHPGQVPDHLTPLAVRHARRQVDTNDRTGWLAVAAILVNGTSLSTAHGERLAGAVLCLAIFLIGGFASDYLGVRWGQTAAVLQKRVRARQDRQQIARDTLER